MTRCRICGGPPAYVIEHARMSLCKDCFIRYYERKVYKTILKHGMLRNARKIAVAVSGGKDSVALLKSLHQVASENFPNISLAVIHVNLGIPGYSEKCQEVVERVCENLGVSYLIYDLGREEGYTIPDLRSTPLGRRLCGACGTVKRYLMNKLAYEIGADRVATGHNLDDTVELLLEVYLKGSVEEIVRVKPMAWSSHPKLVTKIKPLIELTERENLYYVMAQGLPLLEAECPLAKGSRMLRRKRLINMIEREIPGFKHTFYKSHLKRILPKLEKTIEEPKLTECKQCGMPSLSETCSYCKLTTKLKTITSSQPQAIQSKSLENSGAAAGI
ncbi:MAG: hypothetical protein J7L79_00220 [Thaumarchaeota archaeon]|nr:hypothetical protein [Nitrososphaerota archaeon]